MKYSNQVGAIAALALIAICFLPWVYIQSLNLQLSGINGRITESLDFGRQVMPHSFFSVIMIVLFLLPRIWAKRTNILIGAIQFSWAVKNYIVFSMCREGECPEKLPGIYLLIILSSIMLLSSLFPVYRKSL